MCPSALSSSFPRLVSETAPSVWHPSDRALSRPPVALGDSSNINHVIIAMTPRLIIQESVVLAVYRPEIARDLPSAKPHGIVSAVSSQSSVFSPGGIKALAVTSRTIMSNGMEEHTAMSPLKFSRCGYASLLCYLPHTWAFLHPLSTSLHLWKGGRLLLQYSAECPHLSEVHLSTGTTQNEKRGNLSSAHMGPVVSSGADDPTVNHRMWIPPWHIQHSAYTA